MPGHTKLRTKPGPQLLSNGPAAGSDTCPDGQGFQGTTLPRRRHLDARDVRRFYLILATRRYALEIGLIGHDRFLIPFKTNARHVSNVKQSVTDFIGLL
jgi:hypothetical protein